MRPTLLLLGRAKHCPQAASGDIPELTAILDVVVPSGDRRRLGRRRLTRFPHVAPAPLGTPATTAPRSPGAPHSERAGVRTYSRLVSPALRAVTASVCGASAALHRLSLSRYARPRERER